MSAQVALSGATMRYPGGLHALGPVDFDLHAGEFVSIVGPSGCGKSTLLRIAAGLVEPSGGRIARAAGGSTGFVFQEAALLPWRTVARNAELALELEGHAAAERRERAAEVLRLVGLAGFENAYPHQLSGGMRMRLSLARALALRPALLLLDEPLAAVDELTRDVLQEELSAIWQRAGFAAALVTHNVHEAVFLSTRVLVMSPRPGRIVETIAVPFAFPRAPELRSTPEFARLTGAVTAALRRPAALHA
jgi:NitT/TauT family transport system ATP-binding protein